MHKQPNANDPIRQAILEYLHGRSQCASSLEGVRGARAKISEIQEAMRTNRNLGRAQVMHNLSYLLSTGFVDQHKYPAQGARRYARVPRYSISSLGIDELEGESRFERPETGSKVTISELRDSIVQIGDHNQASQKRSRMRSTLGELRAQVIASPELDDESRLAYLADVDSLAVQIENPEPDLRIIGWLADKIGKLADLDGFAGLVERVLNRVRP